MVLTGKTEQSVLHSLHCPNTKWGCNFHFIDGQRDLHHFLVFNHNSDVDLWYITPICLKFHSNQAQKKRKNVPCFFLRGLAPGELIDTNQGKKEFVQQLLACFLSTWKGISGENNPLSLYLPTISL